MTWELGDSTESDKNAEAIHRFLDRVDPMDGPYLISDQATIFDVSGEGESELREAIRSAYGVTPLSEDFRLPLWKLALKFEGG